MSKLDSEVESFKYQQIYSASDVGEQVQTALKAEYPSGGIQPTTYGIVQMVIYTYKIK